MPRKFFRRISPRAHTVRNHKHLSFIAHLLKDPNLFHLNRHSVARAFAIGLGVGVLPIFGHIAIAALLAVWRRANLGVSLLLTWVANPLTIPFILYLEYRLGLLVLHRPDQFAEAEWTWAWMSAELGKIWLPLLIGGLALSALIAFVSYYAIYIIWHQTVKVRWNKRRAGRKRTN